MSRNVEKSNPGRLTSSADSRNVENQARRNEGDGDQDESRNEARRHGVTKGLPTRKKVDKEPRDAHTGTVPRTPRSVPRQPALYAKRQGAWSGPDLQPPALDAKGQVCRSGSIWRFADLLICRPGRPGEAMKQEVEPVQGALSSW
jgi:hypothetical protein